MLNIGVLGTGYVGLVTGTCLASTHSNCVTCMDIDKDKIALLNRGGVPIYEKDLEALIQKNAADYRLFFSDDIASILHTFDVIFIAVGTPSLPNGDVNMQYVKSVCEMINAYCDKPTTIVMKSTVPAGTFKMLKELLGDKHTVISNPEFLREGTAVYDFEEGDRIVIGTPDGKPNELMEKVYVRQSNKIIWMDNASAEIVKYASNCLLATKLALWNEIAVLADRFGANIHSIRLGVGSDSRIGPRFLLAGPGYGGSCFPKDTRGLLQMFYNTSEPLDGYGHIIEAVIESNENHKEWPHQAFWKIPHSRDVKKIAVLGLAFKGGTDDVRESPTHTLLKNLCLDKDAFDYNYEIVVADPVATELPALKSEVRVTKDVVEALQDADVVFVMTEWKQYKNFDIDYLDSLMRGNIIIDARNMWDAETCREKGFLYVGLGVP